MKIINHLIVKFLPLVPRKLVYLIARKYIAGPTLDDAIRVTRELNARGMMATIDVLGEFIATREGALHELEMCRNTLQAIRDHRLDANLSVKPTSLGLGIDAEFGFQNIRQLVQLASEFNNFVRLDMENSPFTSKTLELYQRLRREFPRNVGVVVQAYLFRTFEDVRQLSESPTNIRLCKGIYLESAEIAWQTRGAVRDNYQKILEFALQNGIYVGIATHDDPLIEFAAGLIRKLKLEKSAYEFQMLLGVREPVRDPIAADGHRIRIYVPYGEDWYGYSTRRLKENPNVAGHIVKRLFFK